MRSDNEEQSQIQVVQWFELQYPQFSQLLHHCPNGGSRDAKTGAKLKKMGTKKGFLDLVLYLRCRQWTGLVIEMKHGKNKLTKYQHRWMRIMMNENKRCHTCWSFEEAKAVIKNYMDQWFKYESKNASLKIQKIIGEKIT